LVEPGLLKRGGQKRFEQFGNAAGLH
jgi:hypothetical protein